MAQLIITEKLKRLFISYKWIFIYGRLLWRNSLDKRKKEKAMCATWDHFDASEIEMKIKSHLHSFFGTRIR